MKIPSQINMKLLMLACVSAVVVACGGGEDNEGALDPLSVSPDSITIEWPQDPEAPEGTPPTCGASFAVRAFVNGGAAPYTLQNTNPDAVALTDRNGTPITSVHAGHSFDVYVLGGCFEPVLVNIVDALGRQVTLEVNNIAAEAAGS